MSITRRSFLKGVGKAMGLVAVGGAIPSIAMAVAKPHGREEMFANNVRQSVASSQVHKRIDPYVSDPRITKINLNTNGYLVMLDKYGNPLT